ncbi:MAG: diguanylate cyclase [Campylobacterota bacterium]|nr:diguanylate cyclase [Campylobacterota bacterium]
MIDLSVYVDPYSAKNECGDFYLYVELQDYYLLAVGDIGGHGSATVYAIANKIKDYLTEHQTQNIEELMKKVHTNPLLKETGMTLFLAQIYKNIPLLNYCSIGNIRSFIFRDKNIVTLNTQDGIVGYDIPSSIDINMLKIKKEDLLIVGTDGISFNSVSNMIPTIQKTKNLQTLVKFFATQYKNSDDSLCVALKFSNAKKSNFSIKYTEASQIQTVTVNNQKPKLATTKTTYHSKYKNIDRENNRVSIVKNSYQKKKKLFLFERNYLVSGSIQKESIDLAINKIISYTVLDKFAQVKIKTFLHEIILTSKVDIYVKNNILKLYIQNIYDTKSSLEFLFEHYYIFNENECIVDIVLEKYINISPKEFKDLKRMIELNLNDKDFKIYKEREEYLSNMAYKDNLTQIYNRNKSNHIIESEIARLDRYGGDMSIALIDIDFFKKFNDTYGHLVGDEVLVLLANCLREKTRTTDTYARWGGEEFIVVFTQTSKDGAIQAAEYIRQSVEKLLHPTAGGVTASFGVTQYIANDTLDSMFKRCDEALYKAKEEGRNKVCFF